MPVRAAIFGRLFMTDKLTIIALIYDAAFVAFLVYFIGRAARRGFMRSLVQIVGSIAALFLSLFLSNAISKVTFNSFFRPKLLNSFTGYVSSAEGSAEVGAEIGAALNHLPKFVLHLLNMAGAQDHIEQALTDASGQVAVAVVDNVISPVLVTFMRAVLFIVLFGICLFLVRHIARAFGVMRHIPILGTADGLLGGVLGIVQAFIAFYIVAVLCSILFSLFGSSDYFSEDIIEKTYLFKIIYQVDPFHLIHASV